MQKVDGVFEGGGVKAIGFTGAICCLEQMGYTWERTAGTSAGSIVAALLAVGYSGEEIREIMFNTDYKKLLKKNFIEHIPIVGDLINILVYMGIYDADTIEQWIGELLKKKGKTKFKDICKNGKSKLKIIATDITKQDMLIFPDDLPKYNIDPMEFEIAKAVRMSCTLPFFFKPYKLVNNCKTNLILDGGILSNFPVWIFDVEGNPKWPTFGFKLVEDVKEKKLRKMDIVSFTEDIFDTILKRNEMRYIRNRHKDLVRTILVPCEGVKTTEFNISYDKCNELYLGGYEAAERFIEKWDFDKYIKVYRNGYKDKLA